MPKTPFYLQTGKATNQPTAPRWPACALSLGKLKEINTLRVLFALYELAADDGYISTADLADKTGLCKADAERALENLPVSAKVGAGGAMLYQIEGGAMHIPPLLQMIRYQ